MQVVLLRCDSSSACLHFVRCLVFHAGSDTIENVHDMQGVPHGDVEDFVDPELTDEPVEIVLDASQLRSMYIDIAAAYHQFPDGAASIIKQQKGTRKTGLKGKGMHHTKRKTLTWSLSETSFTQVMVAL